MLAFLAANHRGENLAAGSRRKSQDAVDDLLAGLGGDGSVAFDTMADTDASIQDAEVVVNLGDRADRRAWIASCSFLLNADGRGKAGQVVYIRLGHLAQE